jgi:hypothetical protein
MSLKGESMRRTYVYVVLSGDRWVVKREGRNVVQVFDRKLPAVRAAMQSAQEMHREDGQPTGVRVQLSNGQWEDERTFGNEASEAG